MFTFETNIICDGPSGNNTDDCRASKSCFTSMPIARNDMTGASLEETAMREAIALGWEFNIDNDIGRITCRCPECVEAWDNMNNDE